MLYLCDANFPNAKTPLQQHPVAVRIDCHWLPNLFLTRANCIHIRMRHNCNSKNSLDRCRYQLDRPAASQTKKGEPRENNPRVGHLPSVDNPQVQSGTSPRFRAPCDDDPQVQPGSTPRIGRSGIQTSPCF